MPTTITTAPDRETTLPVKPDGSAWPLLLVHGDRVTGGDTAGELLAQIIPGYDRLTDGDTGHDDALGARYESAVATATQLQEALLAAAAENSDFDAATTGEGTLTALLTDKTTPCTEPVWRQRVPLVLIDTDYQPFTTRPRPEGRVIYLRPAQELDYLSSLAEAGLIEYLVAASA